jgi:hypothetical protein
VYSNQPDQAIHAGGVTPQAWSILVHVDRHHDTKLSPYETREILGFFNRKTLSVYAQLFTISCAVIHYPNGQGESVKVLASILIGTIFLLPM